MRFRGLIAACAIAALPAVAESYPNRPIKIVVPFPAGGGADATARIVAENLSRRLGQPVYVENKPGSGGLIGTESAARMPADGYTILVTTGRAHQHAAPPEDDDRSAERSSSGRPAHAPARGSGGASLARRQHGRGADRAGEAEARDELRDLGPGLAAVDHAAVVCPYRRYQARAGALSRRRPGDQRSHRRPREDRIGRRGAADPALQERRRALSCADERNPLAEPARGADLSGIRYQRIWSSTNGSACSCPPERRQRSWNASTPRSARFSRTRPSTQRCGRPRRRRSAAARNSSRGSSARTMTNTDGWCRS